jgi:hypothetical protein
MESGEGEGDPASSVRFLGFPYFLLKRALFFFSDIPAFLTPSHFPSNFFGFGSGF